MAARNATQDGPANDLPASSRQRTFVVPALAGRFAFVAHSCAAAQKMGAPPGWVVQRARHVCPGLMPTEHSVLALCNAPRQQARQKTRHCHVSESPPPLSKGKVAGKRDTLRHPASVRTDSEGCRGNHRFGMAVPSVGNRPRKQTGSRDNINTHGEAPGGGRNPSRLLHYSSARAAGQGPNLCRFPPLRNPPRPYRAGSKRIPARKKRRACGSGRATCYGTLSGRSL